MDQIERSVAVGIGQDSHRFLSESGSKVCKIGGLPFPDLPGFDADSDGDVILHAICNALSSITSIPILGKLAIDLCHQSGITDSRIYLERALALFPDLEINHVALSLEGSRPRLQTHIEAICHKIAEILGIDSSQVGMTATSGNNLTSFSKGEGLLCLAIVTATRTIKRKS